MSILNFEYELLNLETKRESLEFEVKKLNHSIGTIDMMLNQSKESVETLELKKKSLLEKKSKIESELIPKIQRKSIELKRKITFSMRGSTLSAAEASIYKSEPSSVEDLQKLSQRFGKLKSEPLMHQTSNKRDQKTHSLPTDLSKAFKETSTNIPIEILRECQSKEICETCKAAVAKAREKGLLSSSSLSSIEPANLHKSTSFLPEEFVREWSRCDSSKESVKVPLNKSSGVLSFVSCPSVKVCRECSSLYHASDKPSMHLPLCLSLDLCKTCVSSKRPTAVAETLVDAKSSLNTLLSEVSCFSYDDCENCKIMHEMKLRKKRCSAASSCHNPDGDENCGECRKSGIQSTRPATVHSTRLTACCSTNIRRTSSVSKIEQKSERPSQRDERKSLKEVLKECQSQGTCAICTKQFSEFLEQVPSESESRESALHDKLSLILHKCESRGVCDNCSKLKMLKEITASNSSFQHPFGTHPITNCASLTENTNCRELFNDRVCRSTQLESSPRLSLRKLKDGEIVNVVSSSSAIANSSPANSELLRQSRRHTNSPAASKFCLKHGTSSMHGSCNSLEMCKACSRINSTMSPSPSIAMKGCMSYETCSQCAMIWRKFAEIPKKENPNRKKNLLKRSQRSLHSNRRLSNSSSAGSLRKKSLLTSLKKSSQVSSCSSHSSYEKFKCKIERQNSVVTKIEKKISQAANIESAEVSLTELRQKLNEEKHKLSKMVQHAMYEQRTHNDEAWKPISLSFVKRMSSQ